MSLAAMYVQGIGLLGPGLPNWADAQATLRGELPHQFVLTVLPPPPRLPPAERRRAGAVIRLAMAVAEEAIAHADADPQTLATVFTSSGGEGANCHSLCETLASPNPLISPTRFTNSVHNAASGYWHIAVGSRHTSTSLCAYDGSFAAGLIEAASMMQISRAPLLLVAYDLPYPEPLNTTRPLADNMGVALVLSPKRDAHSIAALEIEPVPSTQGEPPTACADLSLDALRTGMPAGAALPLLQTLSRGAANSNHTGETTEPTTLVIDYLPHMRVRVSVSACSRGAP